MTKKLMIALVAGLALAGTVLAGPRGHRPPPPRHATATAGTGFPRRHRRRATITTTARRRHRHRRAAVRTVRAPDRNPRRALFAS